MLRRGRQGRFRFTGDDTAARARHMVAEIADEVRATHRYLGKDHLEARVLEAMARVPRHEFVPERLSDHAYDNAALPIGRGQTISQPYIVAVMSDLLAVGPEARVLEIGTGSGYQAAVLACLVRHVYSIEVVPSLAAAAAARLDRLGARNVTVRAGDGYAGWPEAAPFDGIIVTAAPPDLPQALMEQLKVGARLVAPIGEPQGHQVLAVFTRDAAGAVERRDVLPVAFVPMVPKPGTEPN